MKRRTNYSPVPRINRLLNSKDPDLAQLLRRGQAVAHLQAEITPLLPATIRPHCHWLSYRNGIATFEAASSAWAARIRLLEPQIKEALQQLDALHALSGIKVKIRPLERKPEVKRRARALSETSRTHLREVAEGMEDGPMRQALEHLAQSD